MSGEHRAGPKVSKGALRATALRVLLFENSVNFERMQSLSFTYAMIPILRELYRKKEDLSAALRRHLQFFNSNVLSASFIVGVAAALEERKANGSEIPDETINNIKVAFMGPGAGIGDAIFWGTFVPIVGGIAAAMAAKGNALGPVLHQIVRVGAWIAAVYLGVHLGYREGLRLLQQLSGAILQRISQAAGYMASVVLGGLVASLVKAKSGLHLVAGDVNVTLQEMLDSIAPNLLALSVFLLLFWLIDRRKWNPLWAIGLVFLISIAAAPLKVFVPVE